MESLWYVVIGFAVVAAPTYFISGFSALHAVVLGMAVLLVLALLRLDELGRVVAENKRELATLKQQQGGDY